MDPMEQLWGKIASPDASGEKCIIYKGGEDLIFLYANGFVDAEKYTLDDWVKAFVDSRQSDGSYRLTHAQWIAKKKYRYNGPVEEPFDPERLPEKQCTEAEFAAILKKYIVPSTWLTVAAIPQVIKNYQDHSKFKDGKISLDKTIKEDFAKMLRYYPSPLRMLQLDVYKVPKNLPGLKQAGGGAQGSSQFTQTTDPGREAAKKLGALFQSPIKETATPQAGDAATTTLKELMKQKRRPPSGRV